MRKFSVFILFGSALLGFCLGAYGAVAHRNYLSERLLLYREAEENRHGSSLPAPRAPAAGAGAGAAILVYHSIRPSTSADSLALKQYSVDPEMFEAHLRYLSERGYRVITLDALADHVLNGAPLPERSVALTLDDGWENQYEYAYPLLKKYGMSATFFIFTNAIGHRHFMTWDQVSKMSAAGMTIGAHSESHPYLIKITDPKKLVEEIAGSKKILEAHIGRPVPLFAYPFGQYDDAVLAVVRGAGFRAARTTHRGRTESRDEIYTLPGIQVQNSMESLIRALRGI